MDFYKSYYFRYLAATKDERQAARNHWLKCHAENMEIGRKDLIIFSAQVLANIDLADAYIAKHVIQEAKQ